MIIKGYPTKDGIYWIKYKSKYLICNVLQEEIIESDIFLLSHFDNKSTCFEYDEKFLELRSFNCDSTDKIRKENIIEYEEVIDPFEWNIV